MSEQVGYCAWCGRNVEAESPAAQPQVRELIAKWTEEQSGYLTQAKGESDEDVYTAWMRHAAITGNHIRDLQAALAASSGAGVQVTGDLLAVAEWAVYALEHGSHVEVHWLQTVAKGKHQWAREVIAKAQQTSTGGAGKA